MKFLIDECLSPDLAYVAQERGFGESMHVNHLGMQSEPDSAVLERAIDRGYVLVTNNTNDFRRRVARIEIHAGLICLEMPITVTSLALQRRLFLSALDELIGNEPINEVLELTVDGDEVVLNRYRLPAGG